MLVIDERFLHQFGVEDLYQVAQHDVRIHNCRFPVVVAPGGVDTGVIVIHEAVPDAADVGELRAGSLQFVERVRHADIQPHVGVRCQQVSLLHIDGRRGVARVLLVDVIASRIRNQPHGIAPGRGHEPRIAVGRIEHHRRGVEGVVRHPLFQSVVPDGDLHEDLFALRTPAYDLRECH